MKKWLALFALAVTALATIPDVSEAGPFRRNVTYCQPVMPCCPVVVWPPVVPMAPPVTTVTIKGKAYRVVETGDRDEYEDTDIQPPAVTGATGIADFDVFKGTDRRVPKTTLVPIGDAPVETFASVSELIATLVTDAKMVAMKISHDPTSDRVKAETRNVQVTGCIYAFKKEDDNDYHVVLGDGPGTQTPNYLNVEVSGIPVGGTAANRKTLVAVRKDFKDAFSLPATGPKSYAKMDSPVPVRITGSLFFDVDHPAGAVGPTGLKPKTAWEIHPVSQIEFLTP